MAWRIYTKTGDAGSTSLIGGTKVLKSHLRIESYGTVDELNSYIGLVHDLLNDFHCKSILRQIQDRLFTIGSSLASDGGNSASMPLPGLKETDVAVLEKEIDAMENELEPLKQFILPGGHPVVSHIHIARCVCRRAERHIVCLQEQGQFVEPLVIKYLNRLSDFLFVLSRFTAKQLNVADVPWQPRLD